MIPADLVAAASLRLGQVVLDGSDIYWIEGRPSEAGRSVVVKRTADGTISDATPPGTNVRTRVQEYGGAAYAVSNGTIYYSEFSDQRLYRLKSGGSPEAMTPPGARRYADATIDPRRGCLVCVREDFEQLAANLPLHHEPETTLVALPLDGLPTAGTVLASGYDFYSTPRFSPDGSQLLWLAWRHPQMPWDGTELWMADISDAGEFERPRKVAGSANESIFQPGWSPDGVLHFVSDRTGWWNLYRFRDNALESVCPMDADCGRPQWTLGTSTWAFAGSALVIASVHAGRWTLNTATDFEPADYLAANDHDIVFIGGTPTAPDAVVRIACDSRTTETLRASGPSLAPDLLSAPRAIEFPSSGGVTIHAFYYAPVGGPDLAQSERHSKRVAQSESNAPPLVVVGHGGPTGSASARLNLELQFWASRGFAVVDVDYRGSSGYGRAYRESLNGQWGIADVDDCVNAALFLARDGLADRHRLIIRGKSAGGFTVLAALTSHPDVFAAGAVYYGIGDLELLAGDTHKFESRYLDRLVGPLPAARDVYRARSPIHHIDRLACPLIVFQGLDDRVVPPEHAHAIVNAVRAKGLAVELIEFPGEGHGFRKAETIVRCLEAEADFYARVMRSA